MIEKLHLVNFKGIKEGVFSLRRGLNIIYGGSCKGKSSIIDALHLLQLYSYYAGSPYQSHLTLSNPAPFVHYGTNSFTIIFKLSTKTNKRIIYRLDFDLKLMQYTESYIIEDTVFTYNGGILRIKDARLSRYTPKWHSFETGELWETLGRWKISIGGLPWRNTPHLVAVEAGHWGGIEEASRNVPMILARVIAGRIALEHRRMAELLGEKINGLFEAVFEVHRFLRGMAIIKHIDFKNALGPSKHLSQIIDSYASNFPWIYLNALRLGLGDKIREAMRNLGFHREFAVESTIDNRFYIVLMDKHGRIHSRSIPYSIGKALIIATSLYYSNRVLAIDDLDEYFDPELTEKILGLLENESVQTIATSRRLGRGRWNMIEL